MPYRALVEEDRDGHVVTVTVSSQGIRVGSEKCAITSRGFARGYTMVHDILG